MDDVITNAKQQSAPLQDWEIDTIAEILAKKKKDETLRIIKANQKYVQRQLGKYHAAEKKLQTDDTHEQRYKNILQKFKHYIPVNMQHWMMFDTWTVYLGLAILNGIDPRSLYFDKEGNIYPSEEAKANGNTTPTEIFAYNLREEIYFDSPPLHFVLLDGMQLAQKEIDDALIYMNERNGYPCSAAHLQIQYLKNYYLALQIWKSGDHKENRYPPSYFIDWAVRRNMPPPWLDWVEENYLIRNEKKKDALSPRERTTLLNIIGALFHYSKEMTGKNQTAIIAELQEKYSGYAGISESTLKAKIGEGLKNLGFKEES